MNEITLKQLSETTKRWGHDKTLTIGTAVVGASMILIAILSNVIPDNPETTNDILEGEEI